MRRKASFFVLILSFTLILSACSGKTSTNTEDDSLKQLKDKGTVVIGGTTTGPPFSFLTADNEHKGLMYDIATKIVDELGLEYKIDGMLYANIIPALEAKKIDMIACGCVITDEKKEVMDFTDPVYTIAEGFVVHKDNTEIKSFEDLKGKKVAASAGGLYYNMLMKEPDIEVVTYKSTQDMVTEIENGRIDAFFQDKPIVQYMIKENPDIKVKLVEGYESQWFGEVGLGLPKGSGTLVEELNKIIKKLKEDGEIETIVKEWDA